MKKLIDIYNKLNQSNLIQKEVYIPVELEVLDITYDSREVKEGTLFFCKGVHFKKEYLENSINDGALAYVSEVEYDVNRYGLIVKDVRKAMLLLAAYFFDYPDRNIRTIGVTGTKGKSTTVFYLKAIFDEYARKNGKKPAGLISGITIYDGLAEEEATLTTPEAIPLYRHLANARDAGLDTMIIEVSSQALKYDRINSVRFDASIFLNIGNDHVSAIEHPTFEDYFYSKLKLAEISDIFVFNRDMDYADKVEEKVKKTGKPYKTYSLKNNADIMALNIEQRNLHNYFKVIYQSNEESYSLIQPGKYNIENALSTILIAKHFGLDYQSIETGLKNARVEGRDEVFFTNDKKVVAWVSYAHNGISFSKSYEVIHENFPDHRVISVFGGSGDKAIARLQDVCNIGAENSDYLIIVPDDPGEKPYDQVVASMEEIISLYDIKYEVYENRFEGIERSFEMIEDDTVLFIAGKGNDKYNYINGQYVTIEGDVDITKRCVERYNKNH